MNNVTEIPRVHRNFDCNPVGWKLCWFWHTSGKVLFLRMLFLQDKLPTQTTIANFYSTVCFQLCGTNVHVYCKTFPYRVARERSLTCRKQCHSRIAEVAEGNFGTPSLLTRHESLWLLFVFEVDGAPPWHLISCFIGTPRCRALRCWYQQSTPCQWSPTA